MFPLSSVRHQLWFMFLLIHLVETQSPVDSPWSQMLEGWVDDSVDHHDEADSHGDHGHGNIHYTCNY